MHPASNWLRHHGVPVPDAHFPPSLWLVAWFLVFAFFSVFIVVEVVLLIKAIATVDNPELHERYKKLMLHWPYALLTPYTIFKTNVLPRVFFGPDERHGADSPAAGAQRAGSQRVVPPNPHEPVETVQPQNSPSPLRVKSTAARWLW